MTNKLLRAMLLLLIAGLAVACGTQATPVFEANEEEDIVEADASSAEDNEDVAVVVVPTETPVPPTPTEEPTATVEPPTATPTEEPTAAPADPIARLIASRDPADGEVLFNQMFAETGFACATCHHVDVPENLIGPSLLNIEATAATRIEGQSAERYIYNSIVNPNDYIVEGFVAGVMPQNWHEVLSDSEIYDIIAYMLTLDAE